MAMARLSGAELDKIEEAMIALGVELGKDKPTKNGNDIALVATTLQKINTIRRCSRDDAVDITPSHGG